MSPFRHWVIYKIVVFPNLYVGTWKVRTGKVNRFPPAGTVNLLNPNIYFHIGLRSPKFKRFILYRLIYQWSLIYTSITYQQFLYIETIWVWHAFVWTIVVAWHALITYQQFLYIQKPYEFDMHAFVWSLWTIVLD
jgi:hypothetical protein